MRRTLLVGLAVLAGCGGGTSESEGPAPRVTRVAEEAPAASATPARKTEAPPLTYPFTTSPVPEWLEQIRPQRRGRWQSALPSPDGKTLLAQWTAECEIPTAYFVARATREPRPVAPVGVESVAVAWSEDGRAGVFFAGGACGGGDPRPGLYLVSLGGEREFMTDDVGAIERWHAARR